MIRVTSGVWVAVGFSNANSALIEGEGGSIVVDTTSDAEDAKAVKAEFAKLSTAPVRAIIYTHSHPDHTGGGGVLAGNDAPRSSPIATSWTAYRTSTATGATAAISSAPPCRMTCSSMLSRARRALADKDFQWAAELSDYVLAIDEGSVEAKRLKAAALSELGERQISAIARNHYLSAAQYLLRPVPAR